MIRDIICRNHGRFMYLERNGYYKIHCSQCGKFFKNVDKAELKEMKKEGVVF